jgi:hypothetical protein
MSLFRVEYDTLVDSVHHLFMYLTAVMMKKFYFIKISIQTRLIYLKKSVLKIEGKYSCKYTCVGTENQN